MKRAIRIAGMALGLVCMAAVGLYSAGAIDFVEGTKIPKAFVGAHYFTPTNITAATTVSTDVSKYDVTTSGSGYVISLPSSSGTDVPGDGQCWEFSMVAANGAASFSPSAAGDLLDATQGAYAGMDALGDSVKICYDAGTTNYYFQNRYIH